MMIRAILLLCGLALAGCGQMGDSLSGGLFGQNETPPPAAAPDTDPAAAPEDDAAAAEPGDDAAEEAAAEPEPEEKPRPRTRDLDPSNTEALDSERVICEEKGGRWAKAGAASAFACVRNTRDANKACTAADQCQGYCLARSGTCSPFTPMFGCHDVISKNGGMQTVCIE